MKLLSVSFICLFVVSFFFQDQKSQKQGLNNPDLSNKSIVLDDPELVKGLEIKSFNQRRCILLKEGSINGFAVSYFFNPSAKYDIKVLYVGSDGKSELGITINDQAVGGILFNDAKSGNGYSAGFREKTIPGINIQKWSKIALQFTGGTGEKCRIEKVVFNPVGAFDGKMVKLVKPSTLEVFEDTEEKLKARQSLPNFVNSKVDSLMEVRRTELSHLKSPAEWRAAQQKTRDRLDQFFGKFPQKTPLNVKITGKIDREQYTIEKLIFESQPGYYVTANCYVPKKRKFPLPGVLFTCGHSDNGKGDLLYQSTCLGLVLKGYVVLAIDPIGQGERIEYFDEQSKKQSVPGSVSQHYYLGRPSFLVNWTLSGLRTWDAIRAVDYLVTRPEVDTSKLAAVGNSGGGMMALLITAVDKRIKVCAAGHPGGQMEKNYLPGQNLIDRQILSLIAPRPVRIIVGDRSGEEVPHRKKVEDMQLFFEGLGYKKDRAELLLVDGVHDMKLPKREAVYEWLNKWFGKEEEGKKEPAINTEDIRNLWATKSGLTLVSLGGETGQTLNQKRLKTIYKPERDIKKLKERVAKRIGLSLDEKRPELQVHSIETIRNGNISVEKLTYQSEPGIIVPALLIKPQKVAPGSPVYIYASDRGKPRGFNDTDMPFVLAKNGFIVLAVDVRGVGETNPTGTLPLPEKYSTCTPFQWIHDCLAIQSPGFGRTMLAMRSFDVIRGVDYINSRKDFKGKKIVAIGDGLGGLWALLSAIYDPQIDGVVTSGTLSSYKLLITNKYYDVSSDYFWVPGALCDFDIPDLARLAAPKPQIWISPIDGLGKKLSFSAAASIIGTNKNMRISSSIAKSSVEILNLLNRNDHK